MKKLLLAAIFILVGLNVFCQDAFIEQLTGSVEIKQPRDNAFKAAKQGDKLSQDTIVSTGFKSFAVIKMGSTTMTVRPLTTLSLTEIQKEEGAETVNVNLQTGRVRVDVKPPAGTKASTTLTSPSTTASVRGTSFEFDTNNLYVNEGVVSYVGKNGQNILVSAGGSSRIDHTGQVTSPRDERNANLIPPIPFGITERDTPVSGGVVTSAFFTFDLNFQETTSSTDGKPRQ